jgi:GAF domain-containing protein
MSSASLAVEVVVAPAASRRVGALPSLRRRVVWPEVGWSIEYQSYEPPQSRAKGRLDRLIAAEAAAQLAGGDAGRWLSELLALADAAMTDVNLDSVLRDALAAVGELLEADSVSFLVADAEGVELVARASVGLAEQVSAAVGIKAGTGVAGRVIATRQPLRIEDLSEVDLASPLLRDSGIRSLVAVPVVVGDRVVGVLHAGSRQKGYFAGEDDTALLALVADRMAVAIERVRLFESELDARKRAETISKEIGRLQRITVVWSAHLDSESLARELCEALSGDFGRGIVNCSVWLYNPASSDLAEPADRDGAEPAGQLGTIPLDSRYLQAGALRTGQAMWLSSTSDLSGLFPTRRGTSADRRGVAILPLETEEGRLGVIELEFSYSAELEADERDFYASVAEQAAQAFDRAGLRRKQEQAASSNAFLAATSSALSESLDYNATLETVVRLIVPQLADLATVHVREANSPLLVRVALAHVDPAIEQAIRDAAEEHRVILDTLADVAEGTTLLIPDMSALLADGTDAAEALAPLGLAATLFVPLRHDGEVLGVLSLGQVGGWRSFDTATRVLIEDVGRRASVAIANARLHSEMAAAQRAERYLLDIATVLAGVTGYSEALQRLGEVVVPTFGDICLIDVIDDDGGLKRVVAQHADPTRQGLVDKLRDLYPPDPVGEHPAISVIGARRSQWAAEMSDEFLRRTCRDEDHYRLTKELGFFSYISVPLLSAGAVLGVLTVVSTRPERRFDRTDLALTEGLADQVTSVVAKARLYDREHRISHILQSNLLPAGLPQVPGVDMAVRYLPGTRDAEVGGDFYDAVLLPTGLLLVIGDVAGHDHQAAATMGHLRTVVRTLAVLGDDPAGVIHAIQSQWELLGLDRMATALLCHLDPTTGNITLVSAGHPPPLLISAGEARFIPVRPAPPLGSVTADVVQWEGRLGRREMLLFYTDGVIDDPRCHLDERMSELAALASRASDVETLCQSVVTSMGEDRIDDVALLAVALTT